MRKLFLLFLLAGAASPALAADEPNEPGWRANREARQQAREERAARADEAQTVRVRASEEADGGADNDGSRANARARARLEAETRSIDLQAIRAARQAQRQQVEAQEVAQPEPQAQPLEGRRLRMENRIRTAPVTAEPGASPTLRQQGDRLPPILRTRNRTPVVSEVPREGTQPPVRLEGRRDRNRDRHGWSGSNWRHDHRYDWRRWRDRHRSLFRLGFYYDPFGWNYRPYSIGWRLWPSYYSSRFWIHDPWQYRLPYAPPGYRWIRYWDDAILVDTWTGEVVDVIHNFFW